MTDPLPGKEPVPLTPPAAADHRRQPPPPDRPADRPRRRARLHGRDPRAPRARARRLVRPQAPPDRRRQRTRQPAGPHAHPRDSPTHTASATSSTAASTAEVLVDCVTYCVLGSVGLDVGGESIPYIAGWGEDGALDAIREYAQTIDTIARRIEDALDPTPEPAADAVAARSPRRIVDAGPVGGCTAPMIGQARPADPRRDARQRRARAGRSHPGRGSCSPRPNPTAAGTGARGDEDELYRRHHRDLHRAVARAVRAPRELIEDACQTAWAILLRSQPERHAIFAWLRVVAIHEAYRLSAIDRRDARLERLRPRGRRLARRRSPTRGRSTTRSRRSRRSARWRRCPSASASISR